MATLVENISSLATRIGAEIKATNAKVGDVTELTTTAKASAVAAINEIKSSVAALEGVVASSTNIDDENVSAATTYSSQKVVAEITAAKQAVKDDLLDGAGTAYDTLKELGDLIDTNKEGIDALKALAAGHVKFDGAQSLTEAQKKQARDNIGASDVASVTAASAAASDAQAAATKAQGEIDALEAAVGNTNTNFVTAFEAALASA